MGKGLPRSLPGNLDQAQIVTKRIGLDGKSINMTGASGVGWGTIPIEGLPEGNILFLGMAVNISFAGSGSEANLGDTWNGDFSLGTTPVDDGTASGGDVDLVASQAIGPASGEAVALTRAVSTQTEHALILDNTGGALEVNLNLLIDDADISGDNIAINLGGFVSFSYIVLGDS